MKVCFETFGCRLNRAEALQQEAEYLAKGWTLTSQHKDADLIIVRACSVTHRAEHDSKRLVAHLKKHYPLKNLIVVGCLPEKAKNELVTSKTNTKILPNDPLAMPTRTARAYLKVQDGCNSKCTFCIVPQFRGKDVSIGFEDVLSKAKRFIDAGYHEIVVTGCNLALYSSEGNRLPDLVAALAELSPVCRIRIGSLVPGAIAQETVDAMIEHSNICRFLHLPIQSGADRILTSMRRPYLTTDVEKLVQKARKAFPLIGLGCDLMTGYPDETETDFIATQGLLKRLEFSNVHVFPYSERPETLAAGLPGAISPEIRHARARALSEIAAHQKSSVARKFIGKDVEILIEDDKKLTGWTGEYFAAEITNAARARTIKRKDIVKVHVKDAHHGHLKTILI